MKKRILSLVLCAAMLLSMCLFLGAGVAEDTTADGSAETTETVDGVNIVSFTNAGPLVTPEQNVGPARVRAFAANDTGSGVKLDKTVTKDENSDTYTVRLEAYATGEQTTTVSTKPCDIVLVLDVSGSMDEKMSQYDRTKKLTALKNAVNNFIDQVAAKETDGVTHRISIVKFAGKTTDKVGNDTYNETQWVGFPISVPVTNTYNYSQIVTDLTDAKDGQSTLKSAVNALKAAGATRADFGMKHAQTVLKDARSDATKVVVMFTDGEPTSGSEFESPVANAAISAAKELKAGGATVYTVGCMDGANGTPVTDINGVSKVNKYMHLVSSNYKNATKMDDPGAATYPENKNESYYLTAKTAAELENAFESINKQTGGSKTELTSTAVLQDAVTPYFEIPADAKVTLKTADCTGVDNSGKLTFGKETDVPPGVKPTVNGNTVSVTGFDYKANWCGNHSGIYDGQKLIVEFTIRPTNDFLGGNGVRTNVGTDDGIYESSEAGKEPVERFAPQNVDVAVKQVTVNDNKTEIYRGNSTNLEDLVKISDKLNSTNNAYVTTTYTIKDGDTTIATYTVKPGEAIGEWNTSTEVSPDSTHEYTVTCEVKNADSSDVQTAYAKLTVVVNTCSLKITKTVEGKGANPNQTFVFDVMKDGKVVTTVVLKDNTSTTITGLAVGDYTVVEDTNWSWSYSIVGDNNRQAALSSTMPSTTVDVTNHYNSHNWLTSIADVINTWISGNAAQKN